VTGHVGELAALGTALCWTVSSLLFTAAARRVGALNVNLLRLGLALVLLAGYGWLARGRVWPTDIPAAGWQWLLLSGFVGFFIGDLCLVEAFIRIGARLTTLTLALTPPLTALIGWTMLDERLSGRDWAGMAVTLAGICLVIAEKHGESESAHDARTLRTGILIAAGAAVGQGIGLVLAKRGMNGCDAFAATQIRVVAGLAGFVVLLAASARRWRELAAAFAERRAIAHIAIGSFFGPVLGVGLALLAVQHVATGIAATIIGLVPVFVIPPSLLWHGERVGWRAITGTLVAVSGVALMNQ
jgi:drug/metabolite transporter (DMT)-like permease